MRTDDEKEQMNRINALDNAVRHRLKEETPEQVVAAAEKYFAFLQGGKEDEARK